MAGSIRLGDIATIKRGYTDPPEQYMRFDNQTVLGIGVTMAPSGDVIALGKALDAETARLRASLPAGLKLVQVASMPAAVSHSVDDFVEAVAEAIGIVLVVSLLSLGFRTGMVVVISIPLVLAATALFMYLFGIGLHKVSLGTLILALGLLVDDAIIAVETMAVKLEQGFDRLRAAAFAYYEHRVSDVDRHAGDRLRLPAHRAGESRDRRIHALDLRSLRDRAAAVLAGGCHRHSAAGLPILSEHPTPARLRGSHARRPPLSTTEHHDVYDTAFYRRLRGWIGWCVDRRGLVLHVTLICSWWGWRHSAWCRSSSSRAPTGRS